MEGRRTHRRAEPRAACSLSLAPVGAAAALAHVEMLERGFTAVGEFHHLHHAPDGRPYANPAEPSERVAAAATGIGLTPLPVLYAHGGFGGAPPAPGSGVSCWAWTASRPCARPPPAPPPGCWYARLGVAPHPPCPVAADELAAPVALSPRHVARAEIVAAWAARAGRLLRG